MCIPFRLFLAGITLGIEVSVAQAQTGFVHLQTHLQGDIPNRDRGVIHAFLQPPTGPSQEIFSFEFAPGSYLLSKVVSLIGGCRASAVGVPFTIVANQWTTVPVEVAFDDCFYQAEPVTKEGGEGSVKATGSIPALPAVDCAIHRTSAYTWEYLDYSTCQSAAPYGSSVFIQQHAFAGSVLFAHLGLADDTATRIVDTTAAVVNELRQIFIGQDPNDTAYTGQVADLSVTRTGGSRQGMLMLGTFHVVNNGPGDALRVIPAFNFAGNLQSFGGSFTYDLEPSLGNCRVGTNQCIVPDLPPGASVDYTLRITGFPNQVGDPLETPYCLLFGATTSSSDPDHANDMVDCTGGTVQVTVTAGNGTPSPATVVKGSATVPMLQFLVTPATAFSLTDITLSASGTGNEQVDVTAVNLYLDTNGNGQVDPGETLLSQGTYGLNNGTVKLMITPPYGVTAPTTFLVTYDFNLTLASRLPGVLLLAGLFPIVVLPGKRRRRRIAGASLLLAVLSVSRCGGDASGPGSGSGDPTFKTTLTGLTASGTAISNLSVPGATVTVTR